jgi:transcription antitermination factor NusG
MATSVYSPEPLAARATAAMWSEETLAESHWYAVYTSARHEKRVAEQLGQRGVSHFLPLKECIHRWKDRRMKVQLPYFPNYLFVNIEYSHRFQVLQVPGVARIVGTSIQPTVVPEEQISALRTALELGWLIQPVPILEIGRRVRIRKGPLEGTEGVLLRKKGKCRLVVSIQAIMRSFALEVDNNDIQPI